ncbi:MAG: DUF2961 domain-containing protein [Planctomycetota bacterium]|nr:DUF2961 domain-containing protein [Planctomycetota bacterium]
MHRTSVVVVLLAIGALGLAHLEGSPSPAPNPPTDTARLKTFSGVGKEVPLLEAGKEVEIFRHEGTGCLTHMWFAMDERVRIRVYVDDEKAPSIDMAMDMGHGYAFGPPREPWSTTQMGHLGGVHNNYRIPFSKSVRVTVLPTTRVFDGVTGNKGWWIIRGTESLPVVIGGVTLPAGARLRLHRLEDYRAKPLEEFNLCDVKGAGALYQVALAAQGEKLSGDWRDQSYQEGCVRAYFDGSATATPLSSGLEDYFLSSGYFHHGRCYYTPTAGLTHLDREKNRFSAYRFHDEDPAFFQDGLRLTLRCGEELQGKVLHTPPPTTYTTYVWVYEW